MKTRYEIYYNPNYVMPYILMKTVESEHGGTSSEQIDTYITYEDALYAIHCREDSSIGVRIL